MGMMRWVSQLFKMSVLLGVAIALAACGGGGGSAAPTGSGGTPVAVEIPALDSVAELPFASGLVVTSSSNIAAALKATPESWVYKSFTLNDSNAFTTGDSYAACVYRNQAGIMVGAWTVPDGSLCSNQENIASFTTPYDGNYHILATGASMAGIPAKIKFKITRNSSDAITAYEAFACDSTNTQISYTSYAISDASITIFLKTIRTAEPQRSTVDITGTINTSGAYTVKEGSTVFYGTNNAGVLQGRINAIQGTNYFYQDGFDSRGSGSNVVRLVGQADMSNTSSPFAISGYTFGAGAANLIDNGTSSTGYWDSNNDPTTCSGSNCTAISGVTPLAVTTQSVPDFTSSQSWDCSGTAEVTATFSFSSSSCFQRFDLSSDHIDCTTATQGNITVTPAVSGTTLSTNSASPTSVSASPSITITGSRNLDTSSTNSSTVTLVNNGTNESVTLTYTTWNSDNTVLTMSPTLTSGQTYKLVLVGSSTTATTGTVIRSPTADPPNDQLQTTGTYYITAQ
jgi:hypothetical protein